MSFNVDIFKVNTLPALIQTGVGTTIAVYFVKNISLPAAAIYCATSALVEQVVQAVFKEYEYAKYLAGAVAGAGAGYLSVLYLLHSHVDPQNAAILSTSLLFLRILGDRWDFSPRLRNPDRERILGIF